jgi:hypothetical protein
LGRYRIPDDSPICDLDDSGRLLELGLKPSDVVTRDYDRSRAWARKIYDRKQWIGARWWSYYDPRWGSIGLWEAGGLELIDVRPLKLTDPEVRDAARTIARPINARR